MSELGYDITGPEGAPVLVLGPSLGSRRTLWDRQTPELSTSYRVVRYDLLGHGDSAAPEGPYTIERLANSVGDLLDELGVERFRYAGVSLGGMVGLWLAAHVPERVEKLAVVCSSAYLPPAGRWTERAAAVRAGDREAVADTVVARWFTPGYAAREPAVVAEYRAMIAGTDAEGYASCCEAIATMDQRGSLPTITAPTLVIAGRDDLAIPPEHGAAIAEAVPGARLVVLDNAAHLAAVEQADRVAELLTGFLEER